MRAVAFLAAAVVMLTGLWACSEPAAEEELVVAYGAEPLENWWSIPRGMTI